MTCHIKWVIPRVVIFNWSNLKSDRNERIFLQTSHFYFDNGTGWSDTSQSLKEIRPIVSTKIQINLRIQPFKPQGNLQHIPNLEAAKVEIQKDIVDTEIQLELKIAQGNVVRRH